MNRAATSYRVTFAPLDHAVECAADETLLACARRAGIRLVGSCGGRGTCKSCLIRVISGAVEGGDGEDWQRACNIRPLSDLVVEPSARSLAIPERTDVDGLDLSVAIDPVVRAVAVHLSPPGLDDPRADATRLADALRLAGHEARHMGMRGLAELPGELRRHNWRGRAWLRDDRLIGFRAAEAPLLGLAFDIGTTNVAGYLFDLDSGARLAGAGMENLQTAYGSDLVTRIGHVLGRPEGGAELARAARQTLRTLTSVLCQSAKVDARDIADAVACGNTAMHHLLLGLPVAHLGAAPFVAASHDPLDIEARELGLELAADAVCHVLPGIGGYVGGDHTATLLATRDLHPDETRAVVDIGTNTEISLLHQGRIVSVSCPSGPALEGGHIACGMRAARGAVERVGVGADGGFVCATIDNADPVGLCGSGVLDAMAAMLKAGAIDRSGRIQAAHPAVVRQGDVNAVHLAGPEVALSQHDIRAIQLAKAAIRAGLDVVLDAAGLSAEGLDRLIVAGAFGSYIDIDSAVAIGLFPALPRERFLQVGNAAGLGAQRALVNRAERRVAVELARHARYLELSQAPGFQKTFLGRIALTP